MSEPVITIDGVTLHQHDARTVREALQSFLRSMKESSDNIGTDEYERTMTMNRLKSAHRINEIIIFGGAPVHCILNFSHDDQSKSYAENHIEEELHENRKTRLDK